MTWVSPDATDLDLHALVRIRVVGNRDDLRVVTRQLGPLLASDEGDPDIVVEFTDRIETGPLTFLGRDALAYDDRSVVVLRGKHKSSIRVRIEFDRLGSACRIECERGAPAVPYLVAAANLAVLAHGAVALHAAAIEHRGVGIVITGWSKGGKTESLLASLCRGGRYIGDEWVYLSGGGRACGVPEPIRVWQWYLDQIAPLGIHLALGTRLRLALLTGADRLAGELRDRSPVVGVSRAAARVRHAVDQQRYVDLPVTRVVGTEAARRCTTMQALVHVVSANCHETTVERVDASDVAHRMTASLASERLPLMAAYHAHRYAFPDRPNPRIEGAEAAERERLAALVGGVPAFEVRHPYPPRLADLGNALDDIAHECATT